MRILLMGQTSLHLGRMEYGNIGNYYIIEPFVRELHRVFNGCEIYSTLQMSDEFCQKEKIARIPLEYYYSWDDPEYYSKTLQEYAIAEIYNKTGVLTYKTPYINEVLKSDLVIDFSGDMWSDNADFVGPNRFMTGLLKDRIAQLLKKKTVMLSGSPTPFKNHNHDFTKEVFEGFDLVTNRENISIELIKDLGFSIENVKSFACPAFIFEPSPKSDIQEIIDRYDLDNDNTVKTGFIFCGWNLTNGPYTKTNVTNDELLDFVEVLEKHINDTDAVVYFMSHSNGFDLYPYFKIKHGRDYPYAKQFYDLILSRNNVDVKKIMLVEEVLLPKQMKAFIGNLDMLISGRIHGAVAGLSQAIPTVVIDYGHEPKAHKLRGFVEIAGTEDYIIDPLNKNDIMQKITECYENRKTIAENLRERMIDIRKKIHESFDVLNDLFN